MKNELPLYFDNDVQSSWSLWIEDASRLIDSAEYEDRTLRSAHMENHHMRGARRTAAHRKSETLRRAQICLSNALKLQESCALPLTQQDTEMFECLIGKLSTLQASTRL
jgi:hypothetical protein